MDNLKTIADVIAWMKKHPNPKALNAYLDDHWVEHSTESILRDLEHLVLGLLDLGIKKGQTVGIMSPSGPYWTIIDIAIMAAGAVSVPIFPNISEENFAHEVQQAEVQVIFISGQEPQQLCQKYQHQFHKIFEVDEHNKVFPDTLQSLLQRGEQLKASQPDLFEQKLRELNGEDIATIIYTSGSTGVPKGAMVPQRAIFTLIPFEKFHWQPATDRYLNILPTAHVFGRVVNFLFVAWGISIYYLNDPKALAKACQEVHPTILVVVPRLLEKLYAKLLAKVQESGYIKRQIALWAFNLAHHEEEDIYKLLMHPIADTLVYSALREAFGGSLRVVISGGAPLNPHLAHFFIDIGIPIYEGWGMTEACPVTVNTPEKRKVGSVGPALPDIELKIGPDGEVLVKGPNLMRGYLNNPEANAKAFDADGWLRTGDKGSLDEEGFLTLQGRLKEMFKTSTGEYVVPVPIEQALCKAPFIDMAVVIAEGRKFASCLLFPDLDVVKGLKKEQGQETLSDEEFLQSELIKTEMEKLLHQVNSHLNHWEQIQDYRFILDPLTVEGGELTPSMKIRRETIEKKYADVINSIYPEETL